jgi:hypothetical protein
MVDCPDDCPYLGETYLGEKQQRIQIIPHGADKVLRITDISGKVQSIRLNKTAFIAVCNAMNAARIAGRIDWGAESISKGSGN